MCERLDCAHGEHLTKREGQVGGFPHLGDGTGNECRHSLAADVRTGRHPVPTGFDELSVRRGEAVRRRDFPIGPAATLAVAGSVQRREHFAGETGGLDQDRLDEFRLSILETRRRWRSPARPARCLSTNRMSSRGAT